MIRLFLAGVFPLFTEAQTVKAVEYFFDSDPGLGNGTRITINPSTQIDTTVNFNVNGLSFGLHQLFIRALENNNNWSLYHIYPVIIGVGNQASLIQKIEYFFDSDPGVGKGNPINLSASALVDTSLNIDVSAEQNGLHLLFIRSMDVSGKWSLYHVYPFLKGLGSQVSILEKIEYFFDVDPGFGNGTPITISPTSKVDTTLIIDLSALTVGLHQVFIRTMDKTGTWSLYNTYPVIKGPGYYQPLVVQKMEFFLDSDPGIGKGIPIPMNPGYITDSTFLLQLPPITKDTVDLYIRAMDNRGLWGLYHDTLIKITCAYYKFKPALYYSPLIACINTNIQFKDSSLAKQWHWKFGDGDSSVSQNPLHKYSKAGNYNISLFTMNFRGCVSDTDSKAINVQALPIVKVGPDVKLYADEQVTLHPTTTGAELQYLWSPNLYINDIRALNPVIKGVVNIVYKLTVTSNAGCTASDSLSVTVLKGKPDIKVPNVFSPNNDNINDKWIIEFLNFYADCKVEVFNRYGQKVFESHGYSTPWDGTFNGKPLPVGTYYYLIEPGKGFKVISGSVTIIR